MGRHFLVGIVSLLALTTPRGEGPLASEHDHLVAKHAAAYGVPESLVRRVIHIESKGNPRVVSKGNYGLMQIRLGTAKAMGYSGGAEGLLNADTNMTYAVRYLAGAYRAAGGNHEQAIRNYQRGYYDRAKAQGFSPYAAPAAMPSVPPQAAAPDPTLLRQQQQTERAKIAEQQRLERQAMLEARITQQKAAEQSRIAERQAMQQAREEQKLAAEQARAAQRQAALQARIDRQNAIQMQRIEQRNAAEARRAAQRQAALRQKLDREARRSAAATAPAVAAPQAAAARVASASPPSAGARRTADGGYSWYNPMRYFKHPAHQAHPLQRER